jgi:hypothetical protein
MLPCPTFSLIKKQGVILLSRCGQFKQDTVLTSQHDTGIFFL